MSEMAISDRQDWHMYQTSLEARVPVAIEDFALMMSDPPSRCFSVEILMLNLLEDGTRETWKIQTPKCYFQKAFLHVSMHLNDP